MLRNLDIEIDLCFTSRIPLKGWQGILSIICIKGQMKECLVEKIQRLRTNHELLRKPGDQ